MCLSGFARRTPTCPLGRIHKPRIHNPCGCLDLCARPRLLSAERATHHAHAISSHRYPKSLPPAPLSRGCLPPAAQSSCLRLSRRPSFAPRDTHNATSVAHVVPRGIGNDDAGCNNWSRGGDPHVAIADVGGARRIPGHLAIPISRPRASSAYGKGGFAPSV